MHAADAARRDDGLRGRRVRRVLRAQKASVKDSILRKVAESTELATSFFAACAPELEITARALAERFSCGGRLHVMGNGGSACDAMHVAVEFQHPIIEKRRA